MKLCHLLPLTTQPRPASGLGPSNLTELLQLLELSFEICDKECCSFSLNDFRPRVGVGRFTKSS